MSIDKRHSSAQVDAMRCSSILPDGTINDFHFNNMLQGFPIPSKYKVLVRCNTFNQSKYIEDTLHGFAIQQTSFPFLVYVIDDASTDGEQYVLRRWIDNHCNHEDIKVYNNDLAIILMSKDKDNENCIYAIHLLKKNLYMKPEKQELHKIWREQCEYEASCEGDDYWIDSLKLQKQVHFLDTHEDYGMVHTDFDYVSGKRSHHFSDIKHDGIYFPDYLTKGVHVATLTVMYRISVYNKLPRLFIGKGWPMGDKPLWYEFAHETKIHYISDVTAKYRVNEESASQSRDVNKLIAFKVAGVEIRRFYAKEWNVKLPNGGYNKNFFSTMLYYASKFDKTEDADKWYCEANKYNLMSPMAYLYYFATKSKMVKKLLVFIKKAITHKDY